MPKSNLLKLSAAAFLCMIASVSIGQRVKFEFSIPLLSYHLDNILDIDNGFNTKWKNTKHIPQFRLTASARNVMLGFEHYYYSDGSRDPKLVEGGINSIRIESYSLLFGYKIHTSEKLSLAVGTGLSYNRPFMALYSDYFPKTWEVWLCYEENKFGALFWATLDRKVYKNLKLGVNLRYNPMFNEFGLNYETQSCTTEHNHDRLNYFVAQLMLGYEF